MIAHQAEYITVLYNGWSAWNPAGPAMYRLHIFGPSCYARRADLDLTNQATPRPCVPSKPTSNPIRSHKGQQGAR